jgi:hypothetical protein
VGKKCQVLSAQFVSLHENVLSGIAERLQEHADACKKLHEKGLWEKETTETSVPKKAKQTVLRFGDNMVPVCFIFCDFLPNNLCSV